jgi:hypothetical protein
VQTHRGTSASTRRSFPGRRVSAVALGALAALLLLPAAVLDAAPSPKSTAINTTFTTTVTDTSSWCCGTSWNVRGQATIPSIGRVEITGTYAEGVDPFYTYIDGVGYTEPYGVIRSLGLTITASNGSLELTGYAEWSQAAAAPVLTWTTTGSGKLVGSSGSGTYATAGPDGAGRLTITLQGTLAR